MDTKTF